MDSYFNEKRPIIGNEESLIDAIKQIGGLYLLDDKENQYIECQIVQHLKYRI